MVIIKLIKVAPGGGQAGVLDRGGGISVEVGTGNQAEPAEQLLLVLGEVGVGQAERGSDRQVLGAHECQLVAGGGQVGGQLAHGPGGGGGQTAGGQPQR